MYTVDDFAYHDDMIFWGVMGYFEKTVIPHKVQVYVAGLELLHNPNLKQLFNSINQDEFLDNLFVHDLSKFSAAEAFGYATYNRETGNGKEGFEKAWHHHKMHNPHHPEYWLNPNRDGIIEPIAMPTIYALEMVADWIGAGKTYGKSLEEWLPGNLHTFNFGPSSPCIMEIMDALGILATYYHSNGRIKVNEKATI